MEKRWIILIIWPILAGIFWIGNIYYPHTYVEKAFYTAVALTIIHIVFKFILEQQISKQISEKKTKYAFKKVVSLFYIGAFLIVLVEIWSGGKQEVTVAFGLISAGIAFALQDLLKNLAGGLIIYLNKLYGVGDRIEINSKVGDVMDIGIFYTTILEVKEWVSGDQATGRLTSIPNGQVLSNHVNNYTKDHNFIWDELHIPISYSSDWKLAYDKILEIVKNETRDITQQAEKEISNLSEKYYLDARSVEPAIYLTSTDNWISFYIRYPTEVRSRRIMRNKITRMILDELDKQNIKISSTTLDIVGFPDLNVNKKQS